MRLTPKTKPTPTSHSEQEPRSRLVRDITAELHRLTVLIDELKRDGSTVELDAAQKMLWGLTLILDQRKPTRKE